MASSSNRSSITGDGNRENDDGLQQVPGDSPTVASSRSVDQQPFCFILTNDARFIRRNRQQPDQLTGLQRASSLADIRSMLSDIAHLPRQLGRNEDIDDVFVGTLRSLVRSYMRHTDRPFPLKYVIDLS